MSIHDTVKIGDLLIERKGKFKPNHSIIDGLDRIDKINFSGKFYFSQKPSNTDMVIVKNGDFVISGINVAKGAMGICDRDACATIHYSSYTFNHDKIDPEYFQAFLKSQEFIKILKAQVKGGIKTEIKPKQFLSLSISLPSLVEQKKKSILIRNFNTKFSNLNISNSQQFKYLEALRQQILLDAISGVLSNEFRNGNTKFDDMARVLKQIEIEKSQMTRDGKIRKGKPPLPVEIKETPFSLPLGWVWTRLQNIIYEPPRNGYSIKTVERITATKTLKLGATSTGRFLRGETKYIDEFIDPGSFLWLKKGDILVQRSNAMNLVGVSAVFDDNDNEYIYPDLMMKIRVCHPINNQYVYLVLSSPFVRNYFRKNASGAQQSMPKINQKTVSDTLIPLPPIEEQKVITEKVRLLMEKCDRIEAEVIKSKENNEKLMQSFLREVFKII